MPRRQPDPAPQPGTALALPADVRADLLMAQRDQITTQQRLPTIKVMPAAAGLFEFTDTNDTEREFEAVVLGSHASNVLWEVPFGQPRPRNPLTGEEVVGPGCSSNDGKYGTPRAGYAHAALQRRGSPEVLATGSERIECATCPYNQFNSKSLVGGTGKGKAVTNQRNIYLLVDNRITPMELVIVNTSIPAFDEYLVSLLNRGIPVQAVVTKFRQEIRTKPGSNQRWAVVTFARGGDLNQQEFDHVLAKRNEYMSYLNPGAAPVATVDDVEDGPADGDFPGENSTEGGTTGDLPF